MPIAGNITSITESELVTQSELSIVEWGDFSISALESFRMQLPAATATILNRVTGNLPSSILGKLTSNGQVILVNPNGIVIGNQGIIEASAFIASTLDVTNASFLKGKELLFVGNSEKGIHQKGFVKAYDGDVFLISRSILSEGLIEAHAGKVGLITGKRVIVRPCESECIVIDAGEGTIQHTGQIEANQIKLQPSSNPYSFAINQEGLIEALYIQDNEDEVPLVTEWSKTTVSGTLIADQGTIDVLGDEVEIAGKAFLSAPEGNIHIGGGCQGQDKTQKNSQRTIVAENAVLETSSFNKNNGGSVIIWSDGETSFYGTVQALGGPHGGNGGLVEVSGVKNLIYRGSVDTSAPQGKTGLLLLDPTDIIISTSTAAYGFFNGEFPANTFIPTGNSANIDIGTLNSALKSNNVLITTTNAFGGTGNIRFIGDSEMTAITSPGNNLTLNANRDIRFSCDTSFTDTMGTATFNFTATRDIFNDRGSFVACYGGSNFTYLAGNNITINHDLIFQNVGTVSFCAGNNITNNPGDSITHNGGNAFSWTAGNNITIGDNITTKEIENVSFTSMRGNIDINNTIAVNSNGGSTSFIVEAMTGVIRYSSDVISDASTTTFSAPATTGDIIFDSGGDFFGNHKAAGTVEFAAGRDINIDVDMNFEDTSGSQNVSLVFTAGRDFINQPPDNINVRNAKSISITAANDVMIQDPITIIGTDTVMIEAVGGAITVNGNISSDANTSLFSAPTSKTGNITFSSSGGLVQASPTGPATFIFNAGNNIFISEAMTYNDLSRNQNVSFFFDAGNDIINHSLGGTLFTIFYKNNSFIPSSPLNIPQLKPNDTIADRELYYMLDRINRFYGWNWVFSLEEKYTQSQSEWYFIPHNKYLPFPKSK